MHTEVVMKLAEKRPVSPDDDLRARLLETRHASRDLAEPLEPEDQVAQAMDDASPTKWHLAHTTWFFETFVLEPFLPGYRTFDARFKYCFNSYYESEGPRQPRPQRGLLTRPTVGRGLSLSHACRRISGRSCSTSALARRRRSRSASNSASSTSSSIRS